MNTAEYTVLSMLEDETWHDVSVSFHDLVDTDMKGTIRVRRNTVVDAEDPQRQLALAVYGEPEKDIIKAGSVPYQTDDFYDDRCNGNGGRFSIVLCLLTMKKDEVADSGFVVNVLSPEDEKLMWDANRFRHTYLDVKIKDDRGSWLPPERAPTCVCCGRFEITGRPSRKADNGQREFIKTVGFEHSKTGLKLEVDFTELLEQARTAMSRNQRNVELYEQRTRDEFRKAGYVFGEWTIDDYRFAGYDVTGWDNPDYWNNADY